MLPTAHSAEFLRLMKLGELMGLLVQQTVHPAEMKAKFHQPVTSALFSTSSHLHSINRSCQPPTPPSCLDLLTYK